LDNTRKRLEREKSEGISYANESIMRQLIEVVDNLERAIGRVLADIGPW
jgi:molecular chaperone GrpE